MRAILAGYQKPACITLDMLLAQSIQCTVITETADFDQREARRYETRKPDAYQDLADYATTRGVRVLRPAPSDVSKTILTAEPDLLISVCYHGRIQQEVLTKVPCINLHAGALPKYAGLAPLIRALHMGESEVWVTAHEMVYAFDAGKIYAAHSIPIVPGTSFNTVLIQTLPLYPQVLEEALTNFGEIGKDAS